MFKFSPAPEAKEHFDELELEPSQLSLVRDLSELFGPEIGLDAVSCRALLLQSIRRWQRANRTVVRTVGSLSPDERFAIATTVRDDFANAVSAILVDPAQEETLREVVRRATAFYIDKYKNR